MFVSALTKQKPKDPKEPSEPKAPKKSKVEVVLSVRPKEKAKEREVVKPKPLRPLPALKWKQVPVRLTQKQADERILIREFLLRFSDLLDPPVAKIHLEELEFIGGRSRRGDEDEDANAWISEMCVKSILTGVLGLLAKDYDTHVAKVRAYTCNL